MNITSAEHVAIELAGAQITIPAKTIADLWIERLQGKPGAVEFAAGTAEPRLGERGAFGIYAGLARGFDGGQDAALEVLDEAPKAMTWEEAKAWAESIGGTLPTRKEAALCFANVPELFKPEWYWTCEQYAGDSDSAWIQDFGNGYQGDNPKDYAYRARAVRRLAI